MVCEGSEYQTLQCGHHSDGEAIPWHAHDYNHSCESGTESCKKMHCRLRYIRRVLHQRMPTAHTHHMWEKPSNPSRACSGFVNTELKRANLPRLFTQMPGCRGTPFFSGNHVDITPIGLRETPSSGMLVGTVEVQLRHCQESSMFCIRSTSF